MAGRLTQTQKTDLGSSDAENNGYDKANRQLTAASERFGNKGTYAFNADSTIDRGQVTDIGGGASDFDVDTQLSLITHPDRSVTVRDYPPRHQLAAAPPGCNDGLGLDWDHSYHMIFLSKTAGKVLGTDPKTFSHGSSSF